MKVIIAEKPSVAREIARIVGAVSKQEGYMEGNGYAVTWAFGHLVGLALPEAYGITGFNREMLPILPPVFTLVPRQVKEGKVYKTDSGAAAQLKIIKRLFDRCERIIVATDSGREGELIFRYIYEYLGCAKPFDRLWISSLTEKAIREGLANLRCGAEYDNLYYAARARSEADWRVGINATMAISIAAGRGTYSLGRVQTPTLAMVCSRYWENKNFVPKAYWQMSLSVGEDGNITHLTSAEKWFDKTQAEKVYQTVRDAATATVQKIESKETTQEPPLLYDLTSLQKEANIKHGFSADTTLSIAQKLYEAGVLTYPRTGSRYISEDVFEEIPTLISALHSHPALGGYAKRLSNLNRRSVNDSKVTDHHALLITENRPKELSDSEATIYTMVAARMLEAFSGKCVKDVTTVQMDCGSTVFLLKGSIIKESGWRGVLNEKPEDEDNETETLIPDWHEGDTVEVRSCSMSEGKTKTKPLHTEATLLAAMEMPGQRGQIQTGLGMSSTAGIGETQTATKKVEDEELRQSLKEHGIGTPATRAAIIETLFRREYMVRNKKSLVPTEKGLAIYSLVKSMKIADVMMTGEWEAALAKIEHGQMKEDTFRRSIEVYTKQITSELLESRILFAGSHPETSCPKCGSGKMRFYSKVVKCDNASCELPVFRSVAGKQLTDAQIADLLSTGKTGIIKGFTSKAGRPFEASLAFDEQFKVTFVFPDTKKSKKSRR